MAPHPTRQKYSISVNTKITFTPNAYAPGRLKETCLFWESTITVARIWWASNITSMVPCYVTKTIFLCMNRRNVIHWKLP